MKILIKINEEQQALILSGEEENQKRCTEDASMNQWKYKIIKLVLAQEQAFKINSLVDVLFHDTQCPWKKKESIRAYLFEFLFKGLPSRLKGASTELIEVVGGAENLSSKRKLKEMYMEEVSKYLDRAIASAVENAMTTNNSDIKLLCKSLFEGDLEYFSSTKAVEAYFRNWVMGNQKALQFFFKKNAS